MNRAHLTILAALSACLWAAPTLAQNTTLTYQGQLANAARQPVSASYPMTFKFYLDREAGEVVWTEAHDSVDVVDGVFTVELGSITPFPSNLGANASLFLGVSVNDGQEMQPRMKVSSALRAQWAQTAEHAKDVRDEEIHPASVSIGDIPVINADGRTGRGRDSRPSGPRRRPRHTGNGR